MKKQLIVVSMLITFTAFAETLFTDEAQKTSVNLTPYKKTHISQEQCSGPCTAKAVIDATLLKKTKTKLIAGENPTSYVCEQLKGEPDIFYDEKKSEVSVCVFKDKSFLLTWDLLK